jgi:glycosyltransferase involved in cell wall biosynthesis|tara:strand:- start:1009 stop:1686 length:678 start_codon:yes stop_codon:yes gene_type:complete
MISAIIPVYNEKNYILKTINTVLKENLIDEIIIVDDASNDGSTEILKSFSHPKVKIIYSEKNKGKGSAIKIGLNKCKSPLVLIQDADLEYDPTDIKDLYQPFINSKVDVVYGSRFISSKPRRIVYFKNFLANKVLSFLVNFLIDKNFSDVMCGYKLIRTDLLKKLNLEENGFAIEIEITMKLSKLKSIFYEVGISYYGRTIEEGKKIRFIDALKCLYSSFKYFFK